MRVQQHLDPRSQLVDGDVSLIDACQHRFTEQRVMRVEPPSQCVFEFRDLRSHPALSHLRQHLGVTLPGDESARGWLASPASTKSTSRRLLSTELRSTDS